MFYQPANRSSGQQEVANAFMGGSIAMITIVANDRRHYTSGTIGWRCHNPPAGGVLLVHGHRINRKPVIDHMRLGKIEIAFVLQSLINRFRAAFNMQSAG